MTSNFPITLSKVEFNWNYFGTDFDMLFIGGIIGIDFDHADRMLKPVFGYSVCQKPQ